MSIKMAGHYQHLRKCSFCSWFDSDRKVLKGKTSSIDVSLRFALMAWRSIDRVHGNAAIFLAALHLAIFYIRNDPDQGSSSDTLKPPLQTRGRSDEKNILTPKT
jgi:hypothetical protein